MKGRLNNKCTRLCGTCFGAAGGANEPLTPLKTRRSRRGRSRKEEEFCLLAQQTVLLMLQIYSILHVLATCYWTYEAVLKLLVTLRRKKTFRPLLSSVGGGITRKLQLFANCKLAKKKKKKKKTQKGSMAADMRLPTIQKPVSLTVSSFNRKDLVVPGDVITSDTGFMRQACRCCTQWCDRLLCIMATVTLHTMLSWREIN